MRFAPSAVALQYTARLFSVAIGVCTVYVGPRHLEWSLGSDVQVP